MKTDCLWPSVDNAVEKSPLAGDGLAKAPREYPTPDGIKREIMTQNIRSNSIILQFLTLTKNIASRACVFLICSVILVGCRSHEIAYISDAQRDSATAILQTYTSAIMPGDRLYIHVASQNPDAVIPFNQETRAYAIALSGEESHYVTNNPETQETSVVPETQYLNTDITGYVVDQEGTIDFPILGKVNVAGLTHDDLAYIIETRLKSSGCVNDPEVTITLMNFRVTVVGEVKQPQQIHVEGTRLTLLEALAICGDLTFYGQRKKITIIRDHNGHQTYGEVNLTKQDLFDSPYYYLRQNDIVYVEPNDLKKRTSVRDPNVPRYISLGVSAVSSINNIIRAIAYSTRKNLLERENVNK